MTSLLFVNVLLHGSRVIKSVSQKASFSSKKHRNGIFPLLRIEYKLVKRAIAAVLLDMSMDRVIGFYLFCFCFGKNLLENLISAALTIRKCHTFTFSYS